VIRIVKRSLESGAKRALQSELGRKFIANPQVQAALMAAINKRAELQKVVTERVQDFAKEHKLVTKDELAKLRRTIRELEATVADLQTKLANEAAQSEQR
jgi:polyhydroxyalkanoate synthesis regulator phasin